MEMDCHLEERIPDMRKSVRMFLPYRVGEAFQIYYDNKLKGKKKTPYISFP